MTIVLIVLAFLFGYGIASLFINCETVSQSNAEDLAIIRDAIQRNASE